jgi:hypothetical protein
MKKHLPVFGSSRCKRSPSTDLTKSCIVPRNNNNAISCGLVEALIIYTAFLCKGTNTIHSPWLCRMQIHGLDPLRPLRELPLIQRNRQPPSAKRPQSAFSAPRQIAKQKTKRIRERYVATFTLISNRSGCRNTPTTRPPPPPQAAKKKAITSVHNAGNSQIHADYDQSRRGSRCSDDTSGPQPNARDLALAAAEKRGGSWRRG